MDEVAARLRRGDFIHMEFVDGARQWWFEGPYEVVEDMVIQLLTAGPPAVRLVEAGDCLFGMSSNSQTWKAAP
ncbi:hypothetical protein [Azorhizobium doebereinerae]|uniref:hypothetical protein n=1 Tax=Azorhizobium doebereinerae TaxID=281091 RepID=UPI000412E0E3|nr:hypothetical protein [Azorhizobium doebereinerae]